MATVTQTTANINTGTGALATKPQAYYDRMLLELRRQREFWHKNWGQARPMPSRYGDTINFRRINKLAIATTPLTEGVTPDGNSAEVTAISATTAQYGDFILFSDVVSFQMVDDILKEYTVEQGHQANETLDVITRDELAAGSNVWYANEKTSRATLAAGDIAMMDDFRRIVLQMKKNHVKPATQGRYGVLISPDTAFDLLDDEKFLKAYEMKEDAKPLIEGEVADIYGMKFVEVVNGKVFEGAGASDVDVHASIVLGNQAYGYTTIKGEGDIKAIVKPLGSAGTTDPLNQRQSIGWKVNAYVAKRLDEASIGRLESVPTSEGTV